MRHFLGLALWSFLALGVGCDHTNCDCALATFHIVISADKAAMVTSVATSGAACYSAECTTDTDAGPCLDYTVGSTYQGASCAITVSFSDGTQFTATDTFDFLTCCGVFETPTIQVM